MQGVPNLNAMKMWQTADAHTLAGLIAILKFDAFQRQLIEPNPLHVIYYILYLLTYLCFV